jgi:cold shock CspA family protein
VRQVPGRRKAAFRKAGAPDRLTGVVTRWEPGDSYGFITGDDGATYFLSASDLPPRRDSLPVGAALTFTSAAAPAPGRRYLRARAVRCQEEDPG